MLYRKIGWKKSWIKDGRTIRGRKMWRSRRNNCCCYNNRFRILPWIRKNSMTLPSICWGVGDLPHPTPFFYGNALSCSDENCHGEQALSVFFHLHILRCIFYFQFWRTKPTVWVILAQYHLRARKYANGSDYILLHGGFSVMILGVIHEESDWVAFFHQIYGC